MSWLNPGAAWALLLMPALIALYMLRPRPFRRPVSSLRLWRTVPQVTRSQIRLRRPPLTLLLLLQILLLAAGAFALLRPALTAPAGRHLVLLLDASGSMLTVEGGRSRFEQARAVVAARAARYFGPTDLEREGDRGLPGPRAGGPLVLAAGSRHPIRSSEG